MKKITAVILCLCILAGLLCACGTPGTGKGETEETSLKNDNNTGSTEIKRVENIGGRMWHLTFGYTDPAYNFSQDTYLSFKGSYIKLDGEYYELENIEELYGSLDCEIFAYMKDFSDAPVLKPVY